MRVLPGEFATGSSESISGSPRGGSETEDRIFNLAGALMALVVLEPFSSQSQRFSLDRIIAIFLHTA